MHTNLLSFVLTPVRKGAFSWFTPDPAEPWMMVGHLFVRDSGVLFVDPPLIPGLVEAAVRLGKPEAVLLTTQNHSRASKYIARKTGVTIYLPEQNENDVDPREVITIKDFGKYETFNEGKVLGFQVYKFGVDYALLSEEKELLVGDNAIGDINGNVLTAPVWFPRETPEEPTDSNYMEFKTMMIKEIKDIVKKSGATSLLPSHGYDIIGDLKQKVDAL